MESLTDSIEEKGEKQSSGMRRRARNGFRTGKAGNLPPRSPKAMGNKEPPGERKNREKKLASSPCVHL